MWRKIGAYAAMAVGAVLWLSTHLQHIDFFIAKYQDPGWMAKVLNLVPTPYLDVVLFLVGVAWLTYLHVQKHPNLWPSWWYWKSKKEALASQALRPILRSPESELAYEMRQTRRAEERKTMIKTFTRALVASPFEIEFGGEDSVDWLVEPHPAFPLQEVRRKCYWIVIHNKLATKDVDNVSVEVERIEELPDRPTENVETSVPYIGHKLRFQRNGQVTMKFSPDLRDRVRLVSYGYAMLIGRDFRIEGLDNEFPHNNHRHRIHIKVTGDGQKSATARFIVWIQDEILHMIREEDQDLTATTEEEPSPPPDYLWMKDAATELYTYARGKQHLLAHFAEEMSGWKHGSLTDGSPDDILDYAATYIAFCKRVPLVGKRAPSTNFEAISFDEVRRCRFVDGAKKLERTHNESIYYLDLAVKKDAFKDLMENVGRYDGFYEPT